jgi:hypothetical protein
VVLQAATSGHLRGPRQGDRGSPTSASGLMSFSCGIGKGNGAGKLFELIKTIGSFVGLLAGAFTLYDRIAKGRPIATITYKEEGGYETRVKITLTNAGDTTVVILKSTVVPSIYFLTSDEERRSLIEGQRRPLKPFFLNPKDSIELVIVPRFKNGVNMDLMDQAVRFSFSWRRQNATWLPQFPLTIRTRTLLIQKLAGKA